MMMIYHPMHPLDPATMAEIRLMAASMKGSVTGPSAREAFDELMERTPVADNVTYEKGEVGGVHGWWCRPGEFRVDVSQLNRKLGSLLELNVGRFLPVRPPDRVVNLAPVDHGHQQGALGPGSLGWKLFHFFAAGEGLQTQTTYVSNCGCLDRVHVADDPGRQFVFRDFEVVADL